MPHNCMKDVIYGQFVCTEQPEKAKSNCTRLTVVRDWINYPGEVDTPTAEKMVGKLLINSAISTNEACFIMTMDIPNFYLMTPVNQPKYVHIKLNNISQEIIDKYNLMDKATPEGSVYKIATKGMCGLP